MLRAATKGVIAAGVMMAAGLVVPATQAFAGDGDCASVEGCGPSTPTTSGDGTVTVTVTSTFVKYGSSGSGGSSTATVKVSPPCYYFKSFTGKEYFEQVDSGEAEAYWAHAHNNDSNPKPFEPYPGWKDHEDDGADEGSWYAPVCNSGNFDGSLDNFFDFATEWFDSHTGVWVENGDTPPVPEIPPELLLEAAQKSMTMPEPNFDWNPKANGGATLVNLETWLWLDDPVDRGEITASAGNSSVTVNAKRDQVTFSASRAGSVDCTDGTQWTPGASSDCVLLFRKAGSTPVTATANWNLTWTANGEDRGALDPITATETAPIDVIEVQNVVTGLS